MKTMHLQNEIILSILALATSAMTAREIYTSMEPTEQGHFCNIEHVAKTLDNMRRNQKMVEQTEPVVVDGYKRVTWKINPKGFEKLHQHKQTQTETNTAEKIQDMSKKPEKIATQAEPIQETAENVLEVIEVTPKIALEEGMRLIQDAFNALAQIPEPITIRNKAEKLEVLVHLETFIRPMNNDFANAIVGIRSDLENLFDAA